MSRYKSSIRRLFLVGVCVVVLISAGCSDNGKAPSEQSTSRPVTNKEAQLLSRVLYENYLDENATFVISSGGSNQGSFRGLGRVDWVNTATALDIALDGSRTVDISTVATADIVFESYVNFAEELRAVEMPERTWVKRSFDATKYGIDAIALFIMKLASTSADNPLLVKQNGAQYLGTENVAGQETMKLKNAGSITYYITQEGELLKVVAPIKGFANDITLIFSERGTTQIEIPADSDAYLESEVSSFYSVTRPRF